MTREAELKAYRDLAAEIAAALTTASADPPNAMQIAFHVNVGVRDAAIRGGVPKKDLKDTWKPGAAGLDVTGWGMCLADFAERLRDVNPAYAAYRHDPLFARATLSKPLKDIDVYLVKKVKAVLK